MASDEQGGKKGLPGNPRRADVRHTLRRAVKVRCAEWETPEKLYTANISRGGMLIGMVLPPAVGTRLEVGFELADGREISLQGHVVRVKPPAKGSKRSAVGVKILTDESGAGSENWFAELMRSVPSTAAPPVPPGAGASATAAHRADRRADPRHAIRREVQLKFKSWEAFERLYTLNISKGGVLVRMPSPPAVGTFVDVRLLLPKGEELVMTGKAARVEPPTPGKNLSRVGIKLDADEETEAQLARYLRAAERGTLTGIDAPQLDADAAAAESAERAEDDEISAELPIAESAPGDKLRSWSPPVKDESATDDAELTVAVALGESCCRVAVADETGDTARVIADAGGHTAIPAVVWFRGPDDLVVGHEAQSMMPVETARIVHSVRRLLGLPATHPDAVQCLRTVVCPVRVQLDDSVAFEAHGQEIPLERVVAAILAHAREAAEHDLGEPVRRAVLTHPSGFGEDQREALVEAAQLAGFESVDLVPEPVAVAIAYGLDASIDAMVGIFDFGGQTLDFSLVESTDGVPHLLATASDQWLGGDDLDAVLAERAADEFHRVASVDLRGRHVEGLRLLQAAEEAKRHLSVNDTAEIIVPRAAVTTNGQLDLRVPVTRDVFEGLIGELLQGIRTTCAQGLADADAQAFDLMDVFLAGGTTHVPSVRRLVEILFDRPPRCLTRPEHAAVTGAALWAKRAAEGRPSLLPPEPANMLVSPVTIGLAWAGGATVPVIERGTPLPKLVKRRISTNDDNQSGLELDLVMGNSQKTAENKPLGTHTVNDLTSGPAGVIEVNLVFEMTTPETIVVSTHDLSADRRATSSFDIPLDE